MLPGTHTLQASPSPVEHVPSDPAQPLPLQTEYRPRHPIDLHRTLAIQQRGAHDPTFALAGGVIWRASRTPEGVAALALREHSPGVIRAAAWGAGASWALEQVPALCGADDDATGFDASRHPVVSAGLHRHPGLRLSRTGLVFDALAGAIMEQKVTGIQAFGAWRRLVSRFGERAPGPTPRAMFAPPTIDGWRDIPSWEWHGAGLEPPQSRTIVEAARRGEAIARAVAAADDGPGRDAAMTAVRGIGAWTAAETRIRALADPDAVSVGDYHLCHEVGFALTGHRTDDDGMLELLEPWRGHRQRVIRLLGLAAPREPRRGPRLHPEDHRRR